DGRGHLGRVDVPAFGLGVDENGGDAAVAYPVSRGHVGQAGHDDLVAGAKLERFGQQVNGYRAVGRGHAVGGAAVGGEFALEAAHILAQRGDPTRLNTIGDVGQFV